MTWHQLARARPTLSSVTMLSACQPTKPPPAFLGTSARARLPLLFVVIGRQLNSAPSVSKAGLFLLQQRSRDLRYQPIGAFSPFQSQRGATANPALDAVDPPIAPAQAAAGSGTLFGAVSLITGSTVGAGMLALPSVTAPAGFGPTAALLVGLWGLLTLQALLIAEVNLEVGAAIVPQRHPLGSGEFSPCNDKQPASGSSSPNDAGQGRIVTLRQMAEYTLGDAGKGITLIYLGLAYSLLVAYTSKAAEVLDFFAGGGLPPAVGAVGFVGAIASLLFLGGTGAADKLNQGLTSVLLGLFVIILGSGASQVDWPTALAHATSDWGAAGKAVPIIFLSLVYHDLVPVICAYLGGNRAAIRCAIVLGSIVPLTMFLSWEAVALNLIPAGLLGVPAEALPDPSILMEASFHPPAAAALATAASAIGPESALLVNVAAPAASAAGGGLADVVVPVQAMGGMAVDPLQVFVRRSSPLVGSAVEAFSFLAVMTSFIGTSLSLSETMRTEVPPLLQEIARRLGLGEVSSTQGQQAAREGAVPEEAQAPQDRPGLALALALGPPLLFTLGRPDAFLGVLEGCGAYGMTLLYGVVPPMMAWQLRKRHNGLAATQAVEVPAPAATAGSSWWAMPQGPFVPGGTPVLAGMLAVALLIGGGRIAADLGVPVDSLGAHLTEAMGVGAMPPHSIIDATLL